MVHASGPTTDRSATGAVPDVTERHRRADGLRPPGLAVLGTLSAMLLVGALVPVSSASREVLSDMDCIVEPSAIVDLGAAVPGLLAETLHDRSDFVAAGTLMGRLESGVEEVALAIAEELAGSGTSIELRATTNAFGARTLDRNRRLADDGSISEQRLDEVRTESGIAALQLRQERESQYLAQLELARARTVLARREIRSPIDGSVVDRFHEAGEYVEGDPVYRVARLDPLHVEVIVPVEYLATLEAGMEGAVTIAVPGFEDRVLDATVRRIDAVADAASGSYGVRLVLPNPDLDIPSGVRCEVDFLAG